MHTRSDSGFHLLASRFVFLIATLGTGIAAAGATLAADLALAGDPAIEPPASTQLAFVRDDQIYLLNADGTGLVQLTNTGDGVANGYPAWSVDGQRLAFARGSSEGMFWDIHVMNADGSNVVQVTHGGYNVAPSWGPDGHTIVFTSHMAGSSGLSVIDLDATDNQGSRVLLDFPGFEADPAWSPDGQTVTFTSDFFQAYDVTYDLGAVNADGSNVRPILKGPLFFADGLTYYFQSAWSPDGQSIGVVVCPYAFDDCYPESAIAVANSDGSGLRVVTQAGGFAKPTWSPDGRWIAYGATSCRTCRSSIRYVQVDGGAKGLIVDNGHSPAWRPEPGARINAGHSGAWFNPVTSGQGQFLDVEPDKQFIFLGWFTYTDDASGNPNEQHWYTAEGNYNGSRADLILYESSGGQFGEPQTVTTNAVGSVTLAFSDCGNGTMSYRFDDRALEGEFPMVRAIPGSANACEDRAGSTTRDLPVSHGMNGAWYDPDMPGQGLFFDVHESQDGGKYFFVSWFTYGDDSASGQRWLTAEGQFQDSRADLVIYETHGGSFNNPQAVESVPVGAMNIDFSDCSNAQLSYSLDDEDLAGGMALSRVIAGGQKLCEGLSVLE